MTLTHPKTGANMATKPLANIPLVPPVAPFLRSPYNYDMAAASEQSGLTCPEPTLAQQQFAEEVDINTIMKKFNLTGQLPVGVRMPSYQDFEGVFDFQTAMNAVIDAKDAFMKMPADVRKRFHNDPAEFVDFCSNEENYPEALKMGLVNPRPAPLEPEATNPPPLQATGAKPQGGPEGAGSK